MHDPQAITDSNAATGPAPDATIDYRPESTIVGDYELLEEVARGGMGVVYKAQQRSLERTVALKLILTGVDASHEELGRFKLEAQAAARLDHPNIVPVYGLGQLEGRPFISMGFVSGPSLSVLISRQGKLKPFEAALLIQKAAQALHYAHQQGVIHRDIKPGNILIDEDGEPRITDFGLAKRQDAEHSFTATGQVLGTPTYMSPEQAAGQEVGPAGDIYSLGATLYTALVGKPPFDSSSLVELLVKLAEEAPVPPHQRDAEIPEALSSICLRCLAKKPEDRYAAGQVLADDLGRFLAGKSVSRSNRGNLRRWSMTVAALSVLILLAVTATYWNLGHSTIKTLVLDSRVAGNSSIVETSSTSELLPAESKLIADLFECEHLLLPGEIDDPWQLRHNAAAVGFRAAFESYGINPLQADMQTFVETLSLRPAKLKEAVIAGMDLWELAATSAKLQEASQIRNAANVLDTLDWRRQLRYLREDNSPAAIVGLIDQLPLTNLTETQLDYLALTVQAISQAGDAAAQAAQKRLLEHSPDSFWLNVFAAGQIVVAAKAKKAEQAAIVSGAIGPLRAAQAKRPQAAATAWQLANVLTMLGNDVAAAVERDRGLAIAYPTLWPHVVAARDARKSGDYATTVAKLRLATAEKICPVIARVELVATLKMASEDSELENEAAELARLAPTEEQAMSWLLRAFELADGVEFPTPTQEYVAPAQINRRINAWRTVIRHRENLTHWPYFCLSCDLSGRANEAVEASREAIKRAPDRLECLIVHVCNLVDRNVDLEEAITCGQRIRELEPLGYESFLTMAMTLAYARTGRLSEAKEAFRTAMYRGNKQLEFFERLPRAYPELQEVLQEKTENTSHWYIDSSRMLVSASSQPAADSTMLSKAIEQKLDVYSAADAIHLHQRFGDLPAGKGWMRMSLARWPEQPRVLELAGQLLLALGDINGAALAGEKAKALILTTLDEQHRLPTTDSGLLLEQLSSLLRLAKGRDLNDSELHQFTFHHGYGVTNAYPWLWPWSFRVMSSAASDRARALAAEGRLDEAKQMAWEQVKIRPEDANAHWAVAVTMLTSGDASSAIPFLEQAAKLDPLNGLIELDWSRALIETQNVRQALPHLQKAVIMAAQGRIRGFNSVPVEAAALAMKVSKDSTLTPVQQAACRGRALKWLQDDIYSWSKRVAGSDSIDHSAAAQVLKWILESKHAEELRTAVQSFPADEQDAWTSAWQQAERLLAETTAKRTSTDVDVLTSIASLEVDLNVAVWVLSKGGSVLIRRRSERVFQQLVDNSEKLPLEPFQVTGISLSKTETGDAELERLPKLTSLSQLYLDGTMITNKGVSMLAETMPLLRLLSIEDCDVSDEGVELLKGFNELYIRKTLVTPEAASSLQNRNPSALVLSDTNLDLSLAAGSKFSGLDSFAVQLSGEQSVRIPVMHDSDKALTAEAWIMLPPVLHSSNMNILIGQAVDYNSKPRAAWYSLKIMNVREFKIETRDANTIYIENAANSSARISLGQAVHVAAVYDGHEYRTYVNGKSSGSLSNVQPVPGLLEFFISATKPYGFCGHIDEIRISSVCRYTNDFEPVRRHEPDEHTLALYHFDEGEGDTIHDSSGHERHAKIVGEVKWVPEEELSR